ncbi:lipoprotein [Spiroplasma endosymbiont of Ammophila pubescens]|uniref:lipoprotein n=1 Tax=Spiroplasma endosymbiont of Ammophila pubescens TaxID=3066315 RepID=UPI0032B2D94C
MKKILIIIGTISLAGTSTTSLVACNTPQEYTKEELTKLKEQNKINTANQEIRDNLGWIAPQEKPFNTVDKKWYYVVWRGDKNYSWRIIKYKYENFNEDKIIDIYGNHHSLQLFKTHGYANGKWEKNIRLFNYKGVPEYSVWGFDFNYIKLVYRWNLDTTEPNLVIDNDSNVKVDEE